MYTVKIQNECDCFKKSNLKNNISFPTQTGAVMGAMKILNQMNSTFCEKHNFVLQQNDESFVIALDRSKSVANCCGNGCCN